MAEFDKLSALDPRNVTLLSLVRCGGADQKNRYLLVKAPISGLNYSVDRAEGIKEFAQLVEQPAFSAKLKAIPERVAADKTQKTGVPTEIAGKYGARGHDAVCVYLGGPIKTVKEGKTQNQAVGSCMTVAGNRLMVLSAYEDSDEPGAYRASLPKLKQWATSIRPAHR